MDSRELRIGNLVKINVSGGKYSDIVHVIHADDFKNTSGAKPIPLTEEWLVKFGANIWGHESSKMASIKLNDNMDIEFDLINGDKHLVYDDFNIGGEHACIKLQIEYVHQLQNLYFALTGEELTIKQTSNA